MRAIIYTKDYCPYCTSAKQRMEGLGIEYMEIDITNDEKLQQEMITRSGKTTVPQIFLHIGGCDDLITKDDAGLIEPLLK